MILPIIAYGTPILKKKAQPVPSDYPGLGELVENMFETMYQAQGIGLAAPQIDLSIRLFIMDTEQLKESEEHDDLVPVKKVFINPEIVDRMGEECRYNEGCLSIPTIREDVIRPEKIVIEYYDEAFEKHEDTFDGLNARVIQHEFDHLNGVLFTDHLKPLKKRLLKKKLEAIAKGEVKMDYKMKFPLRK